MSRVAARACSGSEQAQGRAYADYELGQPRRAIWEAKRERRTSLNSPQIQI